MAQYASLVAMALLSPRIALSQLCTKYEKEVAERAFLPALVFQDYHMQLDANTYGIGGHQTSLLECHHRSPVGFGWNWTRGETNRTCADPGMCRSPDCFADFNLMSLRYKQDGYS